MTDRVRTARWAAALALGPVAAALFTATTAWATSHPPASTPNAVTATSGPADPMADIQQTLDDDTARLAALEQLVVSLRAQAAAIGVAAPTTGQQAGAGARAVVPGPASARRTTQPPAVRRTTQPPVVRRTQPPAVRRTAQPPAVHAVTGASSAKAAP